MITVISGTNRRNSLSYPIAKQFYELIREATVEHVELLNLADLPLDFIHSGMYAPEGQNKVLQQLQETYMLTSEKFLFIMPEYNGSYPGILKLFIDACSVREYKKTFSGKKAALVGVSTGKSGNIRGIDHLRGVMSHVGTLVLPDILPISVVDKISNDDGLITDKATVKSMKKLIASLIAF